ncbi:hypothetical protein HK101_003957 [Irineochytrium annulatum]|nr:hypothetical protein HK101_003957 [Irineochytrium annulatum]
MGDLITSAAVDLSGLVPASLRSPPQIISSHTLATLWAGYGTVVRHLVSLQPASPPSAIAIVTAVVSKTVAASLKPLDDIGHQRKLASYANELRFYEIVQEDGLHGVLGVPRPLRTSCVEGGGKVRYELVMGDLAEGYPLRLDTFGADEARVVLARLAAFHSRFRLAGREDRDDAATRAAVKLHPRGTYWYLGTRQTELNAISSRHAGLRASASAVDGLLGRPGAGWTVVHGDMKAENIQFSADRGACGLCDFQYTGGGYGAVDIAYLLISSVDPAVFRTSEDVDVLLRYYHDRLDQGWATVYSLDMLRCHFDLAVLDFTRFMAGWGMWGSSRWAVQWSESVLRMFESSQENVGKEEYVRMMEDRWGRYFG